jgi:acyl carrier protein
MDGEGTVGDDDQLFETNIIDSIGFIKLLSFIESTFHVSLDMGEFTIDSGTVNGMVDLISNKMK